MATRLIWDLRRAWGQEGRWFPANLSPGPAWSGLACEELTHVPPAGNLIPSLPSVTRTATPQAPEQLPILLEFPVFLLGCLV